MSNRVKIGYIMIKKTLRQALDFKNKLIKYKKIKNPKLYMTILAKNEGDIIEKQLQFHKAMGVDGFIVTDNNSSDNTLDIFKLYKEKGWIKEIICERNNNHEQSKWVDRMIRIARDKYNADWVINSDADEFWSSNSGCLKHELIQSVSNNINVNVYNVLPENTKDFYLNEKLIVNPGNICKNIMSELSPYSLYNEQIGKVIHRTKGYLKINDGNHSVKMRMKSTQKSQDIIIYHYNLRSPEHFKSKMINGGASINSNKHLPTNTAQHWRYFYDIFVNQGKDYLDEYDKVVGTKYIKDFEMSNVFMVGTIVKDFFEGKNEH